MNLVVAGHVDHGKSTLLGRLLVDTGSLPDGRLEAVRAHCARLGHRFEYAFLLDALKDERAQGITIDAARVFFKGPTRDYVIVDAPGHVEFLRNMVTGAARADAALLVIDAGDGIRENTTRHAYLLSALGIRQLAVLVNKMDLVERSQVVFERIASEYASFLARLDVNASAFIPVSGLTGENIVDRSAALGWYTGPTMMEVLEQFREAPRPLDAPFRMPVQAVYRFPASGDERRIVAGTVAAGRIAVGDGVTFFPSGTQSRVKTLEAFARPTPTHAAAGEAVGFTLTDEIYLRRGELAARTGDAAPHVATRFEARVFWLGQQPLVPERPYLLKLGTARVPVRLEQVRRLLDASTLQPIAKRNQVGRHEAAECTLSVSRPIAFDTVDGMAETARFVLVDGHRIAGGGIVTAPLPDWQSWSRDKVDQAHHDEPIDEPSETHATVVWLTGLSGAGKSTIGEALRDRLHDDGVRVEYLDGDALRASFPGTGFSRADRDAHVTRVGYLASRLEHHGVVVICALISPYEQARRDVRALCRRFIEVYVATPLDECERRDVKGLYARARRGELTHFTGIDDPYEPPAAPEITIDTRLVTVAAAVEAILETMRSRA